MSTNTSSDEPAPTNQAFRTVPKTGVIFVMNEAAKHGYKADDPEWVNLGQGQPETGPIEEAPDRFEQIPIANEDCEYAPISGLWELKEAVASHYNQMYRKGMPTKYSAENVCISSGGRAGLTRLAAALGSIHLGHFLPDYTAYEELLELFRYFLPIPITRKPENDYEVPPAQLKEKIRGLGLSGLLLSNPCNPTGDIVGGEQLARWVETTSSLDCTLILDEFYSHYDWRKEPEDLSTVTAAKYIDDIENDSVVIVNGLTKSWRYPSWRISWTLAPKEVIEQLKSAGSFLDGGAPRPLQRAAIPLLSADESKKEILGLQKTFQSKRRYMIEKLESIGVEVHNPPEGTFYVWGDVSNLPSGLDDGMDFFEVCLDNQLITVPGEFFDVNPGQRRSGNGGRFEKYVRFSFGPKIELLQKGLDRLEEIVENW
jgi:aspartate/methionine/tyrosine aminotransferase